MAGKTKRTAGAGRNHGKAQPKRPSTESREHGGSAGKRAEAETSESGPSISKTRSGNLQRMLLAKRQETLDQIQESIGQSLTEDQQRRLEAAMDVGDQALMDLQRELGISLLEMRNRKRQLIDEALVRLAEGTYGICAECGVEISEKRLEAVPFAKLCVECQSQQELMEKISREEERD